MKGKTQDKEEVSIYAVGDVSVNRENPESIMALSAPIINEADIAFCQLETNLSERGWGSVGASGRALRAHPKNVSALKYAGFDVVSFASNHCLDWGVDAFFDTIDVLKQNGFLVIGAGKDIAEARKPLVVERKGTRVAFLSYNSILPYKYWADIRKPGCAPMRVLTAYEQPEPDQPGLDCIIHTFADRKDLEAMKGDIAAIRPSVDIVVVSLHGGLHFVPAKLAMYQKEVGYAAIDAGADLILGHHAHVLKGIEVYRGKVIFYGLANFAFDAPRLPSDFEIPSFKERMLPLNANWHYDADYPTYGFPVESRKTILAKCIIVNKQIEKVSYLPVLINKQGQPEILTSENEHFDEVVKYMEWICRDQGLGTKFSVKDSEVLVNMHRT